MIIRNSFHLKLYKHYFLLRQDKLYFNIRTIMLTLVWFQAKYR